MKKALEGDDANIFDPGTRRGDIKSLGKYLNHNKDEGNEQFRPFQTGKVIFYNSQLVLSGPQNRQRKNGLDM